MLLSKFIDTFNCVYSKFSKRSLFYKINNISLISHVLIYIDNFEDCLVDNRILDFICELCDINVQIMLSTRCIVEGTKNILLDRLNIQNCLKLFIVTAQRNGKLTIKNKRNLERFITDQLDQHTFSIKLVASKAYLYRNEIELIDAWHENKKQFLKDATNTNDSLKLSVYSSYNQISNNNLAIFIWCCFTLFPKEIDYNIFHAIFYNNLYDAKKAVQLLIKHNMIERTSKGYYMLQPIRDVIFSFIDIQDVQFTEKDPVEIIISFFLNDDTNLDEVFSIACYALIFLIRSKQYLQHKACIVALIKKCENLYKKYAYTALPLVEAINKHVLPCDMDFPREKLLIQLADLYHIVGDNSKALSYYEQAWDITKTNNSSETIKNLRKQCEIYRLFSQRENALRLINQAYDLAYKTSNYNEMIGIMWQKSEVYRLIDRDYDQALKTLLDLCKDKHLGSFPKIYDVFWSIGEIYQKKRKKRLAREYIKKAINGFNETNNSLGLGYAYLSLASINKGLKNSNSLNLCEDAIALFDKIGYDLGQAHAFLWKSKYYFKCDAEIALQNLNLALEAYSKVGYKSGVDETNTLITRLCHRENSICTIKKSN